MAANSKGVKLRFPRSILPETTSGRVCVFAFALGVIGFVALMLSIRAGEKGGDAFFDNMWLGAPGLVAAAGLVCAFPTGLFSIVLGHERSAPVVVATAVGLFATVFIVGEIVTPH